MSGARLAKFLYGNSLNMCTKSLQSRTLVTYWICYPNYFVGPVLTHKVLTGPFKANTLFTQNLATFMSTCLQCMQSGLWIQIQIIHKALRANATTYPYHLANRLPHSTVFPSWNIRINWEEIINRCTDCWMARPHEASPKHNGSLCALKNDSRVWPCNSAPGDRHNLFHLYGSVGKQQNYLVSNGLEAPKVIGTLSDVKTNRL